MGAQLDEVRQNAAALIWYLRRPSLHREMLRRLVRQSTRRRQSLVQLQQARDRALAWCEDVQTDFETAAAALGIPTRLEAVRSLHPEAWSDAVRAAERCPVKMGGPGHVDVIYHLCRYLRPKVVVETGVAFGWSTLVMLLALEQVGEGQLYSIDMPYRSQENDRWVGCIVPPYLRARWTLVRKADRDGIPDTLQAVGALDVAHYDSDKSYDGRMFAYNLLYQHLRPGGVLMSDDVDDNSAFRDFADAHQLRPFVIRRPDSRFAGLVQKGSGG